MTKIRGKKVLSDKPMVMDADFLAKNGNGKIKLKKGEHLKIIGGITLDKIVVNNGAILEGDGVIAHRVKAKKHSNIFIKEADKIKSCSGSEVHVEHFNDIAKIRNGTVFEDSTQLTREDATKWSGEILPAATKTLTTIGVGTATYFATKDFDNLNSKLYVGAGAGIGVLFINSKINKFFDKHYDVKK